MTRYRTIVADPPWPYRDATDAAGRSGSAALVGTIKKDGTPSKTVTVNYGSMSIPELCAICPPAADDAHLYLWTTNAFMAEAHEIAFAWGFSQKTILTWVKVHQDDRARVSMKTGYYFRGATEHCLFCVRGSQRLLDSAGYPTAYLWPRPVRLGLLGQRITGHGLHARNGGSVKPAPASRSLSAGWADKRKRMRMKIDDDDTTMAAGASPDELVGQTITAAHEIEDSDRYEWLLVTNKRRVYLLSTDPGYKDDAATRDPEHWDFCMYDATETVAGRKVLGA